MFDFQNKVAVVTGAARGIGKNIAIKFAKCGATTLVVDRDEESASALIADAKEMGLTLIYENVDLGNIAEIDKFIETAFAKYGKIDIVVNNARAGGRTAALQESNENYEMTFSVNVKAPLFISQKYINTVYESHRTGCIINISSIAASLAGGESVSYHLSKAGLENLTKYLAVFGGPKGVRVNAVQPGFIVQDEHQRRFLSVENENYRHTAISVLPLRRVGSSDDIADACLFLASDFASFITGQIIAVDGGMSVQDQWALINNYSK